MVAYSTPRRINAKHIALAILHETARPRSWRKWVQVALDALDFVPALRASIKIPRLAMLWLDGDYFGMALMLAELACVPGVFGIVVKVVCRVRKLWQDACFAASIASRARCLAPC